MTSIFDALEDLERFFAAQDGDYGERTYSFDQLVAELRETALALTDDTALVFNCQMGRGRTTTGMVCGSILLLAVRWLGSPTRTLCPSPRPLALAPLPNAHRPQPLARARTDQVRGWKPGATRRQPRPGRRGRRRGPPGCRASCRHRRTRGRSTTS